MSDALEDPRLTVVGLLAETWTGFAARITAQLAEHGLDGAEFEVLLRLGRSPGGLLRMGDLAAQTSLTSSGITRLVDRLVATGSVRAPGLHDRPPDDLRGDHRQGPRSPGGGTARPSRPDRALAGRPHPVRRARGLRRHAAHPARRGAPVRRGGRQAERRDRGSGADSQAPGPPQTAPVAASTAPV